MKKFIIIALIIFLLIGSAILYLNQVILPQKIQSLVVSGLSQQTGKNVTLKSLEFNIFKGLILHDLVIADGQQVLLSTRQATCTVFIWPIFKKQIIIPSINLKAPYIFLERRTDGSFNLQDLFKPPAPGKSQEFNVAVFKVRITNGSVAFQDDTLPEKFKKEIKNIQLILHLGLPVKLKFKLSAQMEELVPVTLTASGEYKIFSQELSADFEIKHLPPAEFSAYYGDLGKMVTGLVDLKAKVGLKNQLLAVDLDCQGDNLTFTKDNLSARLNAALQARIAYWLETKKLAFSGGCDIRQGQMGGLEFVGEVKNLQGRLVFNEQSLAGENMEAELFGFPFKFRVAVKDFGKPALDINTDLDLSIVPGLAKDKFNLSLIKSASGKAGLLVRIFPNEQGAWQAQGGLVITGAAFKLDKVEAPIESLSGQLKFSSQGLSWSNAQFKYQGINYQSSGTLSDFALPAIKLKLETPQLSLAADLVLSGQKVRFSRFKGSYLNSQFSISGDIDRVDPEKPQVELAGRVNLDLNDLEGLLQKIYPAVKACKPRGKLEAQFSLSGEITDFKNCAVQAKLSSDSLSLYGLQAQNLLLDYLQEKRIARVTNCNMAFYDGVIAASAALNLNAEQPVYHVDLSASGVRLEKLKMDTNSKTKEIAGIFSGQLKLNGRGNDLAQAEGSGSITIEQGKLGGLNLLKGLGSLLLSKDLGNIEFTGASCDFSIKDKFISSDDFKLTSSIVNLSGPLKIGLDHSLSGALDVEVLSEKIPMDGTFKDVATAIIGQGGGKFGLIKLGGTLEEPKYGFKTDVSNIIQGLANVFLKK